MRSPGGARVHTSCEAVAAEPVPGQRRVLLWCDRLPGMPTNPSDEPAAQAHALLERLFALLHDCRAVVPQLEAAGPEPESVSGQAERLLYYALVGALEAGLVRTAEDALTVLRQASQPLGPMGAEWLARQERNL